MHMPQLFNRLRTFLFISLFLLLGPLALAQTPGNKGKSGKVKSEQPVGRRVKSPAVADLNEDQRQRVDRLFFDALREKLAGNTRQSEQHFREIIKLDPANAQARVEVARLLTQNDQAEEALALIGEAIVLQPDNPWHLRVGIDISTQKGRPSKAIEWIARLRQMPGQPTDELGLELAAQQAALRQYDEAIKTLQQLEKQIGVTPEVSEAKRQYWQAQNKPDKATMEIRNLCLAIPMRADLWMYYGQLAFQQGDVKSAQEAFRKAIELEPRNGKAYLAMADVQRVLKNPTEARRLLEEGFFLDEVDQDLQIQIIVSLLSEGSNAGGGGDTASLSAAERLTEEMLRANPESSAAWNVRAEIAFNRNLHEQAVEAYTRCIALDGVGQKYSVWQQYLLSLYKLLRYPTLITEARRAQDLFPNQPIPYYLAGLAAQQMKQNEEAVRHYKTGVSMISGNPELAAQMHSSLGDLYHELKDYARSDESFEKALKVRPDYTLAMNNYAYYLSLRGDKLQQAEELSRRTLELEPGSASYLDTYGWILYRLKRYPEARNYVEKALKASGDGAGSATLHEHLGDILFRLDDTAAALASWKRAREVGGETSEFLPRKISEGQLYE
ncbi:MAG: tetratricopeptide repeat protein [Sphingomonadales bacterium]|nr:tetratricopeptide repeat protein [Sphingomonadales bacterium]